MSYAGQWDLLVFTKEPCCAEDLISSLQSLLYQFDTLDRASEANEVIDLNRYRIITKPKKVFHQLLKANFYGVKPFTFINNKN
jgi:hypothetical protein